MVIAKYEPGTRQRGRAWTLTVIFGFCCVLGGVSRVMQPGWRGPLLLGILTGLWAVFGYALLSGPVYRAELTGTELRWRTPFRNGSRPLSKVTSMQWNGQAMVVEFGDRQPVLLPLRLFGRTPPDITALANFAERVRAAAPHITVAPPPVPWSPSAGF
ncbi:MAG TPA: hypothetical protein VGG75_27555 [Trebonia sp.]|jgi:hypothetical protein